MVSIRSSGVSETHQYACHHNVPIKERGKNVKRNDKPKNGPEESLTASEFPWSEFYVIVPV
jgi:hypothetical protein